MNPFKTLLNKLIDNACAFIISAFSAAFVYHQSSVNNFLKIYLSVELAIKMLLAFLLISFFLLGVIFDMMRAKRFKTYFYLPWDKHLNPRCPKCESVLIPEYEVRQDEVIRFFYLECHTCPAFYELFDHNSKLHNVDDARKLIKSRSIFEPRYF
jgi:hypothetical protein